MIFRVLILLFLASCSSGKIIPTTDVCSLEKHWKDNLFQVAINGKVINSHYYLYNDALEITRKLADRNKCMH